MANNYQLLTTGNWKLTTVVWPLTPGPWPLTCTNSYVRNYPPFLTNKANFPESQINATKVFPKDYENWTLGERRKNKANSKPNKANSKPISPETNPIQTQNKPKQSQFQGYLAKMGHHELKYVDRLRQLTLNLIKNSKAKK